MGGSSAARLTLEPGWTWADCIKPVVQTDSCQLRPWASPKSGAMHIAHEDGTEQEIRAPARHT